MNLKITKFSESFWRMLFYGYFVYLGYVNLLSPAPVSWLFDSKQLFLGWPYQHIPDALVFYYNVQLACYVHQLLWTEVNRSDAQVFVIHHISTIVLIIASHLAKFYRIGLVTFMLLDISDVLLESAKCFNYASRAPGQAWLAFFSHGIFALFATSFFLLRILYYPYLVVYGMAVESRNVLGMWPGYYLGTGLLALLYVLQLMWFQIIAVMIYRMLTAGTDKDERSDDEEEIEEFKEYIHNDKVNSAEEEKEKEEEESLETKKSQKKVKLAKVVESAENQSPLMTKKNKVTTSTRRQSKSSSTPVVKDSSANQPRRRSIRNKDST